MNAAEASRLFGSVLKTVDRMDAEAFATFLSDDVRFVFGNSEAVTGRSATRDAVTGFFASINGLSHRIIRVFAGSDAIACHGEVTYLRQDDSEITLPFANVFVLRGEQIKEYLIFIDITPLYA